VEFFGLPEFVEGVTKLIIEEIGHEVSIRESVLLVGNLGVGIPTLAILKKVFETKRLLGLAMALIL
jgi:hypothetical protein